MKRKPLLHQVQIEVTENGVKKIISRSAYVESFGNFQIMTVSYKAKKYIIGDGDEYLVGMPKIFTLGKEITK